ALAWHRGYPRGPAHARLATAQAGVRPRYRRLPGRPGGIGTRVSRAYQGRHGGSGRRVTTPSTVEPLAGYSVAVTAARGREEFGAALDRRGARVVYAPAIRIVPLADDTELREATERCLAAPLDFVVATTGIGFRGWMDAADTWGMVEKLTEAVGSAIVLA